jgi:menaquinol-cytochrome c reductase iron-sulfur subunit
MSQQSKTSAKTVQAPAERRNFLVIVGATVLGAIVALVPFLAGVAAFLDPLRRHRGEGKWFRVGTVDSLEPGIPRRVTIVDSRDDAWTHHANEPIGAIFLVLEPDTKKVVAFNTTCPHAGCSIGFQADKECFLCPCHTSAFNLAGEPISPVPPRGMDSLDHKIENGNEIWVKYQEFITGKPEKIPKA